MEDNATLDPAEAQRQVRNRLRRAQGQLNAVIEAVESEASCKDVVTQLAAVSHALNRAGFMLISSAMRNCVQDPTDAQSEPDENRLTLNELEKLFLTLS